MPESTEQRARNGLAVCLRHLDDGRIRLVLDDVRAESDRWPQTWRSHVFLTHKDYDAEQLRSMGLSSEQFAEVGEVVVAYLLAVNGLLSDEHRADS